MATDPNVSDSVKLAAIRDALDRAGLKPTTIVDLEVSTKPWEQVFEEIAKARFAQAYTDQNERDYEALRAAVASGRVTAE